jgi:FkbM family methyltransferase
MINLISFFAKTISNNRNKIYFNKFYSYLDSFLRKINNVNFNSKYNGEDRILKILSKKCIQVIFDVGANIGDFTNSAFTYFPKSEIHSFELVPDTFFELKNNTNTIKQNLYLNNFGLSNENSIVPIYIGLGSDVSTAFKIQGMKDHENYYKNSIKCKVMKGLDYLNTNNIQTIDFLKIDTEGNDLRVIKGFEKELYRIKVIQFEYGIFNIQSKDLLIDFYNYLENNNFVVGKIFPNHIDFTPYHFLMENFHGGNFLAINKRDEEFINLFK